MTKAKEMIFTTQGVPKHVIDELYEFEKLNRSCDGFNEIVLIIGNALTEYNYNPDMAKSYYRLVAAWHKNAGCNLEINRPHFIIR